MATETKQNPYACTSMTSQYPWGTRLNLNISLSLIGRNGPAHVFCPDGIFFVGRYIEVNLIDLIFYSTPMSFYYGSATIQRSVFTNITEAGIENFSPDASDGILKFHSIVNLTISNSVFKGNAKIWVIGAHLVTLTNSRLHSNAGMAATIFPSTQATIIVDNCAFINNWGGLKVSEIKRASLYLTNTLFSQNSHRSSLVLEFDSSSVGVIKNITVEKSIVPNSKQRKDSVVYIALFTGGYNYVQIINSTFKHNTNIESGVGAIIVDNGADFMLSKGCKDDMFNTSIDAYSLYRYTNQIVFRNSVLNKTVGSTREQCCYLTAWAIFRNCTFVDNFALFSSESFKHRRRLWRCGNLQLHLSTNEKRSK
ncbi:hypothetical protein OS493_018980 [Desmophyllum pertusum]|uniref:Uncharacterized protein n=1 Tax=Desmophyllum pertusum TaxID=174260 RepID=A0A9W9Z2G9_9CNID|nr:hypothetical protein OS493_018980 [Desmophyllum pertusum]